MPPSGAQRTSGMRLVSRGVPVGLAHGRDLSYTDGHDARLQWKQVQPATSLVNGEGNVDLAPNGDVIAIGWDPYSGDHLQAFK